MRKLRILMEVSAIAAVGLASIGSAYADGPGGTIPNTYFTQLPGVAPTTPGLRAPVVAATPSGQPAAAYATQSNRGTWLFPPHDRAGAND